MTSLVGDTGKFIEVLRDHAHLPSVSFARDLENLEVIAVGDGNLNDVVRVKNDKEDSSVIIKYAPPFIKCLGPEYPLGVERGAVEYEALVKFNAVSPGCCPDAYFYDTNSRVICMEDLKLYKELRQEMIGGVCSDEAVKCIARHIAIVHRDTHIAKLGDTGMADLLKQFSYTELVRLTEQYIFTGPFTQGDPTNRCSDDVGKHVQLVYNNPELLSTAAKMKRLFLEKKECLIHGDLHTGSIMVAGDSAKMMDMEFACVGPASFDIGILVANYIMSYYQHMSQGNRQFAYRTVDFCKLTGEIYMENMTSHLGEAEGYYRNFISEVAGFAGCEIIRRILGVAHVEDLEGKPFAEVDALGAGVRLLSAQDRIDTMDRLVITAHMLTF